MPWDEEDGGKDKEPRAPWNPNRHDDPSGLNSDKPPYPIAFSVTKLSGFSFKVSFKPDFSRPNAPAAVHYEIRHCPVSSVGNGAGVRGFPSKVLAASILLGSVQASSAAESGLTSVTFNDETVKHSYIIVVGVSAKGTVGFPTQPWLLDNTVLGAGTGGDVFDVSASLESLTDSFGNPIVKVNMSFRGPTEASYANFYGMQPYIVGYMNDTLYREVGSMVVYPFEGIPGKRVTGSFILPADPNAASNPVDLYFVSVGKDGSRTNNPASKPVVVFAGGIT